MSIRQRGRPWRRCTFPAWDLSQCWCGITRWDRRRRMCWGPRALEGLELKFEQNLAGKNGFTRLEKDARRRPIGVEREDYVPPSHGQHLVLTIDANIQMLAEEELANACEKFGAKRGEVVVIDP